ncbi:hypothetical protein AVEN_147705-1 [Araneus ventricosus]|uniref:Uncharacterized protein n=1 Tax=Araneus ventricosus TaxID=182803 RepID=A0A4Y2R2K7_ARAVE|nr:hypothetical protein AVEN_147705-1 [Araneus ventricosus]
MDPQPRNLAQLATALESAWLNIPVNTFRHRRLVRGGKGGNCPLTCKSKGALPPHFSKFKINDPSKNGSQAEALLNNIESFQFIFCLLLIQRVLEATDMLSKALQSKSLIFLTVKELVNATKECLHESRSEDFFEKLWIYVNDICEVISLTSPKLPRSRKVSSEIGGSSFSMSQSVKSFY